LGLKLFEQVRRDSNAPGKHVVGGVVEATYHQRPMLDQELASAGAPGFAGEAVKILRIKESIEGNAKS